MCEVIRFLDAEGQPAIGILSNWSLKIQNDMPPTFFTCWRSASYWNYIELVTENSKWYAPSPLSMNWIKLHFKPLEHFRSGFQGKKDWKITWNSIKRVAEISKWDDTSLPFQYELDWTTSLAFGTSQKWISRGERLKNNFQGQPSDLQYVKIVLPHTFQI